MSDDSFITFRVVDNFLNGYGLRWNPLERVQVYTHPLWLFLLIPIQWVIREISISAYLLSYLCGILFIFVYCFTFSKFRNTFGLIVVSLGVFFSSRTFIDYNTSGLENPLSFLLLLLFEIKFYSLYLNSKQENVKIDSYKIGLLTALLLLTRLDLVLFLILPGYVLFWGIFKKQRIQFFKYSFLGIFSWVIYLAFSIVYFGSLLPNTYYAKTNVLFSFSERIFAGWNYIRISLKWDPIIICVFGSHIFWVFSGPILKRFTKIEWILSKKEKGILWISLGSISIVLFYLLWIGGDFMAGRFLGTCLIVSVFSQSVFFALHFENSNLNIRNYLCTFPKLEFNKLKFSSWKGLFCFWDKLLFVIILIYFFVYPLSPFRYMFQRTPVRVENGVVDERASYHDNSSLKHWIEGVTPETHPWSQYAIWVSSENRLKSTNSSLNLFDRKQTLWKESKEIQTFKLLEEIQQIRVTTNVGLAGFYGGPQIHWVDLLGITDPFLARLPGKGFPGHYVRLLPQGYKEYIEEISVSLPNKELDRFYYEVRLLSEEEIWTKQRWKVILDFTFLGNGNFKTRYPFVLKEYRNTLYGFPFMNWKDEDLTQKLIREYFGSSTSM
ncbi:putative membrane protein [Leptospira noguchii str. 2001034031]|uniref:Putative membrane protein n=1 Tax=Leptospira noguchii str. 2001034031 TaxID=1193053 RepID=M6YLF6_9LEPT|nr:putative membrane protein [Leptospira noguchii str. 2001034031]